MVSDVSKLPKNYIVENIIETLEKVKEDFEQGVSVALESKGSNSIKSLFTPALAHAVTSSTTSSRYSFDTIPSFNFGQREKASFAVMATTLTSTSSVTSVSFQCASQNRNSSSSLTVPPLPSS